jgi:hypothetical protein
MRPTGADGRGVSDMANGFFAAIFKQDKQAVERLHREVTRSGDRAINSANALSDTIKGMIERKQILDGKPANGTTKGS